MSQMLGGRFGHVFHMFLQVGGGRAGGVRGMGVGGVEAWGWGGPGFVESRWVSRVATNKENKQHMKIKKLCSSQAQSF